MPECPMCGCPDGIALGQLGMLLWISCRDCGIEYSVMALDFEDED